MLMVLKCKESSPLKRIEIDAIDPRDEQVALLAWAARVEAGEVQRSAKPRLQFASYRQLHLQLGLIEIQDGKLHVPYDEIDIRKTFA